MDHELGQRFADAAALKESGHDTAGEPVVPEPRHRSDQRVAVRREREGPVDPALHAHFLQHRVALVGDGQLVRDPVDVLLDQIHAVLPRRPVDVPVLVIDLVDAEQHALLVLAQVSKAFQVHRHRHLEVECRHLGDGLGHQIVMRER